MISDVVDCCDKRSFSNGVGIWGPFLTWRPWENYWWISSLHSNLSPPSINSHPDAHHQQSDKCCHLHTLRLKITESHENKLKFGYVSCVWNEWSNRGFNSTGTLSIPFGMDIGTSSIHFGTLTFFAADEIQTAPELVPSSGLVYLLRENEITQYIVCSSLLPLNLSSRRNITVSCRIHTFRDCITWSLCVSFLTVNC